MAKWILLIFCNSFLLFKGQTQCPDEKFLRDRLDFLNYKSNSPAKTQLAELLPYLDSMNDCPYRNDSTHVLLLRKIARIYSNMGDNVKALSYEQNALRIVRSNIDKANIKPADLVTIYYFLSIFYDSLNNVREKQEALDSCVSVGIRLKSFSEMAFIQALAKVFQFNYDIGDYQRCIENATVCEKLATQYINSSIPYYRDFGIDLASNSLGWHLKTLMQINKYDEAKLIVSKLEEYRKIGLINRNYLGFIYSQEAELEMQQGNYQLALQLLLQAYNSDRKVKFYLNCKQTLKDIGFRIYYEHLNDGDMSLIYYKKALAYTGMSDEKSKDIIESLDLYSNMANVYVQKNLYDSAFRYFQLAFDLFRIGGNEADILHATPERLKEIKKIDYVIRLVSSKGDAYMQKYQMSRNIQDLSYSILVYKVMDSLLDRIKTEQIEIESKLFWRNTTRQMYEHAIDACYMSGDLDDAFYFFEKSRAVILNDLLTEQRGQTNNDILELSRARKKVKMLEREMQNIDTSSAASTEFQNELLDSRYHLDQLKQAIKKKNPIYYQNFLDPIQTSLKDIDKKILNDHQALLEIYEGERAVYSLLVTRQRTYFNKIDKDDYDRNARLYLSFLSNPDLLNSHVTEFERTAHQLYEMIFRNCAMPSGRIIISPDGAYFPFEAMVTDNRKPGSPVYFIQDHAVSYTYSARYLMNDFNNNENKTNGSVLGIAPVHYPYITSLDPLIGSDLSLNIVESYFKGGRTLTGGNASRNNFLKQFSNYSVIQLYTHASDSSDRKEPVIYFSDSSLYMSELIQESKPSTKLAVISACNTGNGKLYLGEGVFSFNRAFATVGIPASVINLWSIDSKSTYRITELFYKYLSGGMPMDRALQSAKLEFIRNADRKQALPYYWAPAILIGKTEVIDFNRLIPFKTWLISVTVILLLFVIGWLRKKRESFRPHIPHQSDLLIKAGEE